MHIDGFVRGKGQFVDHRIHRDDGEGNAPSSRCC